MVTPKELRTYYAIRTVTKKLGISDEIYLRPKISRGADCSRVSREHYDWCVREELDLILLSRSFKDFETDALYELMEDYEDEIGDLAEEIGKWKECAIKRLKRIRDLERSSGSFGDGVE